MVDGLVLPPGHPTDRRLSVQLGFARRPSVMIGQTDVVQEVRRSWVSRPGACLADRRPLSTGRGLARKKEPSDPNQRNGLRSSHTSSSRSLQMSKDYIHPVSKLILSTPVGRSHFTRARLFTRRRQTCTDVNDLSVVQRCVRQCVQHLYLLVSVQEHRGMLHLTAAADKPSHRVILARANVAHKDRKEHKTV
ncbi:hypothetical protein C0Q70_12564 [Pomacea canaliculata]|uniref:Uncharacterized protein n=1 Tax=Pomacea canaliculata TaxID=400727 RepID=A0A2T7P1V8_POMCA|nr:hypothetical protein C0Q70_12564 [Pomacea canaliculata]